MLYAAQALTRFIEAVEEADQQGDELTKNFIKEFEEAHLEAQYGVDRRIAVLERFKGEIEFLKQQKNKIEKYMKAVKNLEANLKEDTKYIMEANPGFKYRGELGRLALQRSPEKVEIDLDTETKYLSNCIPEESESLKNIPDEFLVKTVILQLNREAIKAYLSKEGAVLPWARTIQDKHIRIYRA